MLRNDYAMWASWFMAAGLNGWAEPRRCVLYQDASQQMQAVMEVHGVGLVRRSLAMHEVASGRLVRLFDIDAPSPWSYWIACPEPLKDSFRVRALREWLHEEVRQFRKLYDS